MRSQHESIRVFKSPFLEKFTHVHPLTPLILWTPMVLFLMWRSFTVLDMSPFTVGALSALGFFLWTLTEYLLHRFVFHFTAHGPTQERFQFLIHGLHHDDPVDPTRLVMPPIAALFLAIVFYSGFRLFLGPVWVEPFFASFVVGYLCYDYIHFGIHHFNPKSKLGKFIKQHHMQHHFVSPNARWGVSSPLWDYVFGTLEETETEQFRHGS